MSCLPLFLVLSRAISSNDIETIRQLLVNNSESLLNHPDRAEVRSLLLSEAINCKNTEIVDLLVNFLKDYFEFEAEDNLRDKLETAIDKGDLKLTELLLRIGAKIERNDPVAYGIFRKNRSIDTRKQMFKLLLDHGLDVNVRNEFGRSLFYFFIFCCVEKDDPIAVEIAEVFNDSGMLVDEVEKYGWSPLIRSISTQNTQLVSFFTVKGADVNAKNKLGHTALHEACRIHNQKIISLLIKNGATTSVRNKQGKTPFSLLRSDEQNYDSCVRALIREFPKPENLAVLENNLKVLQENLTEQKDFEECKAKIVELTSDLKISENAAKNKKFAKKFKVDVRKLSHSVYDSEKSVILFLSTNFLLILSIIYVQLL